ncbi:hypothetical protein PCANB_001929 [Pneumocystis canis]|nr:hypothetical protein PCANB_001929 [Pneumocystis canis]
MTPDDDNTHDEDNSHDENFSYEQIWDDSALIAAWDATVHEYKKYHSLENQDDNDIFEKQELQQTSDLEFQKEYIDVELAKKNINESRSNEAFKDTKLDGNSKEMIDTPIESTSVAPPLEIFDNDQTLKSLLMSWYYAGC